MKLYRLLTEKKNVKFIKDVVSKRFSGFTIFEATGFWHGKAEKVLIIEIMTSAHSAPLKVNEICKAVCGYNKQECVLVQKIEIEHLFIANSGIL